MAKSKTKIEVQGLQIQLTEFQKRDYISLTDIAKHSDSEPHFIIQN